MPDMFVPGQIAWTRVAGLQTHSDHFRIYINVQNSSQCIERLS